MPSSPLGPGHRGRSHLGNPPTTYSAPDDLHDPPSPRSQPVGSVPVPLPIPGTSLYETNAIAGPSSEGALNRKASNIEVAPDTPRSPSSAPAVPSVISMTHPPQYIHTHHPRRGSMTPLGLNVISPVSPYQSGAHMQSSTSFRTVGFSPGGTSHSHAPLTTSDLFPTNLGARRGSATSTSSTLTQSRPHHAQQSHSQSQHPLYPPGFRSERRRSSLTPSIPTLAAPSPSRAVASGRSSRPTSSDGTTASGLHSRARTEGPRPLGSLAQTQADAVYSRRGSLPHLNYGRWNGPRTAAWNPSLPPQRGSVGEDQQPEGSFKFGSGTVDTPTTPSFANSSAAAALRSFDLVGSRRASSVHLRKNADVFEQAEAEEAERQRRAFEAATYGADGQRARDRLSIGGPGHSMAPSGGHSPGSTTSNLRRQSLMLWERMHGLQRVGPPGSAPGEDGFVTTSTPTLPPPPTSEDNLGARRGSLPIAIPGGGLGRAPSRRDRKADMDQPPTIVQPEDESESEEEDAEGEDHEHDGESSTNSLARPMPPLLPLSDPGPRLLPSTLALHRASHLLNSRNLQAEPLPHPLPPSLHPPAPVDFAEFDIDFILAGSRAQLGGSDPDTGLRNAPVDIMRQPGERSIPATPTLKLGQGGEDEDTFAKFVGQFDDEYGDRRGEWTFRACGPVAGANWQPGVKAEWESQGAGRYEIHENGEVRSVQTQRVWRVKKTAARHFELQRIEEGSSIPQTPPESYILACKAEHCELGGVKIARGSAISTWFPALAQTPSASSSSASRPSTSASGTDSGSSRARHSISDALNPERTARMGSTDSDATTKPFPPFAQSFPGPTAQSNSSSAMSGLRKKMAGGGGLDLPPSSLGQEQQGRASISFGGGGSSKEKDKLRRTRSRDPGPASSEDEKKKGLGGVFKRGIASLKPASLVAAQEEKRLLRDERELEKAQSQTWSPSNAGRKDYIHPSGRNAPGMGDRVSSTTTTTSMRSEPSGDRVAPWLSSLQNSPKIDKSDQSNPAEMSGSKEGKAWSVVPDEAVALVLPVEDDIEHRQALLVWYVPFNSDGSDDQRPTTASTSGGSSGSQTQSQPPPQTPHARDTSQTSSSGGGSSSGGMSTSLPKLQKLLRRRASKDRDMTSSSAAKAKMPAPTFKATQTADTHVPSDKLEATLKALGAAHPLPFRSFRIVARVVDIDDLRDLTPTHATEGGVRSSLSYDQWQREATASSASTARPSPNPHPHPAPTTSSPPAETSPPSSNTATTQSHLSSGSTAPTSSIMPGRTFPTVLAVCHSRSQGVEFVLEGLDRLGYCQGESAWGPTGYEEWRGSGLSDKGRELVEVLWAGCLGVMGLIGY